MFDRALIFLEKSPSSKNDQKWPKNWGFGLVRKIYSLVLSGNSVEWKYLWPFNILWKPHMWEKSGFQVMAINGSWPITVLQIRVFRMASDYFDWTQQGWLGSGGWRPSLKTPNEGPWAKSWKTIQFWRFLRLLLDCLWSFNADANYVQHTSLEAYLKPSQISEMELFCENNQQLTAKKLHHGCLNEF